MEDLKLILIDRLKSKGMDPALIPAFLKALTSLISSEPGIDLAQVNRKMHSLGGMRLLSITTACRSPLPALKRTQNKTDEDPCPSSSFNNVSCYCCSPKDGPVFLLSTN